MILAVDPGIRGTGVALFKAGLLFRAAYIRSPAKAGNMAGEAYVMAVKVYDWLRADDRTGIIQIAVEWPRVYVTKIRQGDTGGADPNDLIALSAIDAAIAALLRKPVYSYYPSDWKGQMSKEACQHRIEGRLSPHEFGMLDKFLQEAGAKGHNVWDAVGIGLHHLGRLKPTRIIST